MDFKFEISRKNIWKHKPVKKKKNIANWDSHTINCLVALCQNAILATKNFAAIVVFLQTCEEFYK